VGGGSFSALEVVETDSRRHAPYRSSRYGAWRTTSTLLLYRALHGGHDELVALADVFGPALHDGFLLGVEAHTFFAVRMGIAEQAALPAAKAVPGHGYGNGHVHADHAHLNASRKLAGGVAVAGEARDAIAELVAV